MNTPRSPKVIIGAIGGFVLLVLAMRFPMFAMMMFYITLPIAAVAYGALRLWRFVAPERQQFRKTLSASVEVGPMSGGLVPMLAGYGLMALIVLGALGW